MEHKKQNYTPEGYQALLDKLEALKVRREENKKDISTARSFGDLSENSEYDEAKNEQVKIATEIEALEERIKYAVVIDESEIDASKVGVGSTVEVYLRERDQTKTYYIVGSFEADPLAGRISDVSPIGRALMGYSEGDSVVTELPNGNPLHIEIRRVSR
ncbi:MAG: transcription elongation factor GreA [Clostridia bacterium]|nr:transcription elongation factor GreA [Clostridia bacterium]